MTNPTSEQVSESRRLLENPYAYLDGRGYFSALSSEGAVAEPMAEAIRASRRLLQNPYAYLDGAGNYSATLRPIIIRSDEVSPPIEQTAGDQQAHIVLSKKKGRYSNRELEQKAKAIHKRLWLERDQIWIGSPPTDPIDMLDPAVALTLIGYGYGLDETLGQYRSNGKLIEVAGTVDNSSRQVRISRQFQHNIRSFTAAHELGHALLHHGTGIHRDRPLDGAAISRDAIEIEADKFATYFLMPEKLVKQYFKTIFLTECFSLSDETAFALSIGSLPELQRKCKTSRDLSRVLADTERFNRQQFVSIAKRFRVSSEAMAIRLEELRLVSA